jgi:serine/threonine-protein kinase
MFSHKGVIDIYDAGELPDGRHFLAMEFFDAEDLEHLLEREKPLAPRHAVALARQVFETLAAAHEAGIVHRDVKPANILVSRDGATARLMDFGIAIIRDLGEFENLVFRTVEGGSTGTPAYMSPEQAAEDQVLAPSDLYSMALVLYECLSGRLPFFSETEHGYVSLHMMEDPLPLAKASPGMASLPKELHTLLEKLFDKTPQNRPSEAELLATLEKLEPQLPDKKAAPGGFWGKLFGK